MYKITDQEFIVLDNSFSYHPSKEDQPERYINLRAGARNLGAMILSHVPPSAERTLAIRKLEECIMWAHKAIACNE